MSNIDGAVDAFLSSAGTTAAVAPNSSPERTAKALDLSARSGVPVDVIQLNIEAAAQDIELQERAAAVRGSPELQAYVNSSPIAAQVSSDDFGPLQSFLDEVKNFVDSDPMVKAVRDNFDTTTPLGFQPGSEAEEFFRSIGMFKDPNRADPGALVTEPIIRGAAAAVDLLARATVAGTAGLGAGVEEIVRSANEAIGGQPFGNPGRANREMQNFVNFWILKMGFDSPVMLNPDYPLSNRTFQFLKKAEETKPVGTAPPKAPWQMDPLQLQLEYFATKAEFDAAQLDAAVQTAVETKTRQRAPAVFQGMVEQNLGDRTIGVSAEALRDLYKSEGVVPGPGDAIMGFVPDIAERLKVALATGADVEVPFAAYLAHIDPAVNDLLLPNIRSRSGMTIEEAKAAQEELEGALKSRPSQLPQKAEAPVGEQADMAPFMGNETISTEPTGPIETAVTKTADDLYLSPLFQDAKSAGMTEPEFALYSKRLETAVTAAREADIRRLERQTTRELTQEWRTTYAEELAKAEAEFDSRRDVVAARFIRDGSLVPGVGTGTPNPLEVTALGGVRLPKGMAIKGGVEPDEIAGLLGYATGAELVEDLGRLTAQQGRKSDASFRASVTKEIAQDATLERFGDPGERAQAVIDLIAEQDISDVLHQELQALWHQGGGVEPLSLDVIKDWATEAFNRMKMKDAANVKRWANAVQKAGRKAELALLRNDIEAAFKAKNEQLISTIMLQNSLKLQRGLPRLAKPKRASTATPRKGTSGPRKKSAKVLINTYTGKVPKAVSPEYAVQIQKILQAFGYKTKANPEAMAEAPSLAEFVMKRTDSGLEPAVAYQLYDPTFYRPMSELSVAEYDVVIDSLRSLDHLGRLETKVLREGKKQELLDVIDEIERRVSALPYRRRSESGLRETQRTWRYAFDSRLVKMEEIIDDLDLQDPLGPLNQTVFVPIVKGEYKEMDLFRETAERLKGVRLTNPHRTVVNTEFINPMSGSADAHNPYRLTRADVVMMALNFGNKRNRELLVNTLLPIEGGLGPEMRAMELRGAAQQVLDFIDRNLTKEDWDFVQAIWAYFEWLKPQVDEVYERLSGVAPDTVEATPFVTSHGEMPGGYVPIISDPNRSKAAAAREKSLFDSSYHKATTPNGYTKPRTQGSTDPMLVQNAYEILQHRIRAMLHDIALREPVIQAGKILTNRKVRETINKHYGPEYVETFGPWLRYVANHFNEEDRNLGIISRMMRTGRQNMAIVVLGLNLKTILTPNVGPAIRALKDLGVTPSDMNFGFMNWGQLYNFALERSQELQHRKANMDRDVSDILRNVVGMSTKYQRAQARAAEFGMALTAKIDQALAAMVWNAEYRKALQEGKTEVEAAEIGDKQVRKYHGSASPANLAALFRGGETSKTLTVFMQFMNMIYNRQRAMVRMAQKMPGIEVVEQGANAGGKRDFAKLLSDFFAITIPTALFTALYDPGTVDDEDWGGTVGKLLLSSLAGSIPFAREIYSYAVQGLPPRNPGIVQVVTNLIDSARDLSKVMSDEDPSDKWLKHAINVPGYLLGLPTGQMANSAQYLWNVSVGEDDMDDFNDFLKGMIYGTTEPGK